MFRSDVIIGLRYGDEGKGKITAALCSVSRLKTFTPNLTEYAVCVRFNGGPNAGHTVYKDGRKIVTHSVPTGIVYGKPCFIGPGCVVGPISFLMELETLAQQLPEYKVKELVKISPQAHIISAEHIERDKKTDKVGSTGRGIGPCYSDKMLRTGVQAGSYTDETGANPLAQYIAEFPLHGQEPVNILFEGAQGAELDIDIGKYPYVTSSPCLPGAINSVVPITSLGTIIGVAKAYDTYVGSNEEFEWVQDPVFEKIRELGQEYGATTGRARKIQWLDLPELYDAIRITGATKVYVNKVDILERVGVFKFGFRDEGAIVECVTLEDWKKVLVDYLSTLPWGVEVVFSGSPNGI